MSDISITASSVQPATTTTTDSGIAGAAITAGQPLYKDATDSNYLKPAQATTLAAANAVGVALHGASRGQPIRFATGGDLTYNAVLALGTVYVVSANAGGVAPSADLDTSTGTNYGTILGIASSG